MTSLLLAGGPLVSNGVTALFSVVAVIFFVGILQRLAVAGPLLGGFALALTPVVYVNSTCTMDYVWALAFLLGATYFVLADRCSLAGLFVGLATGCRISSMALVVPLGVFLFMCHGRRRVLARLPGFLAMASAVALACYVPVLKRYGLGFFTFVELPDYPPFRQVLVRATSDVWGTAGVMTLAFASVAVIIAGLRAHGPVPDKTRQAGLALCGLGAAIVLGTYLRLPYESGYLVPMVPFVLIGLGLLLPPRLWYLTCLALCLSPFIHVGRTGLSFDGPLLDDHVERLADSAIARAITCGAARQPGPAVIVCGHWLPRITESLGGDHVGHSRFVYAIPTAAELRRSASQGERVFVVPNLSIPQALPELPVCPSEGIARPHGESPGDGAR